MRLTPRGKTLLEEMWRRETDLLSSLELNLSNEDLQAASRVLQRLREALENQQRDQQATKS